MPTSGVGVGGHPHHRVAEELHDPAAAAVHDVGRRLVERGQQAGQRRQRSALRQRGEAGQVGEADAAAHDPVDQDVLPVPPRHVDVVPVRGVERPADARHDAGDLLPRLGRDQLAPGDAEVDALHRPHDRALRVGQPPEPRPEHPHETERDVRADERLHVEHRAQHLDVVVAEHRLGRVRQAERLPRPAHDLLGAAELGGRLGAGASPSRRADEPVAGQREQPPGAVGLGHLLERAALLRQPGQQLLPRLVAGREQARVGPLLLLLGRRHGRQPGTDGTVSSGPRREEVGRPAPCPEGRDRCRTVRRVRP